MADTIQDTTQDFPTLQFRGGLPGFPDVRNFVLMNTELAQDPFSIMKCLDDPELEFVVTTPGLFFPEYSPEIDDTTVERCGINSAEDVVLLVILQVGDEAVDITANLLGPIVINRHTNVAAQAVLQNQPFDLREPLFNESIRSAAKDQ